MKKQRLLFMDYYREAAVGVGEFCFALVVSVICLWSVKKALSWIGVKNTRKFIGV